MSEDPIPMERTPRSRARALMRRRPAPSAVGHDLVPFPIQLLHLRLLVTNCRAESPIFRRRTRRSAPDGGFVEHRGRCLQSILSVSRCRHRPFSAHAATAHPWAKHRSTCSRLTGLPARSLSLCTATELERHGQNPRNSKEHAHHRDPDRGSSIVIEIMAERLPNLRRLPHRHSPCTNWRSGAMGSDSHGFPSLSVT
jgi:hypothetical protein